MYVQNLRWDDKHCHYDEINFELTIHLLPKLRKITILPTVSYGCKTKPVLYLAPVHNSQGQDLFPSAMQ